MGQVEKMNTEFEKQKMSSESEITPMITKQGLRFLQCYKSFPIEWTPIYDLAYYTVHIVEEIQSLFRLFRRIGLQQKHRQANSTKLSFAKLVWLEEPPLFLVDQLALDVHINFQLMKFPIRFQKKKYPITISQQPNNKLKKAKKQILLQSAKTQHPQNNSFSLSLSESTYYNPKTNGQQPLQT